MIFEEVLQAMRSGKKITHPSFDEDVYFMACRVSLGFCDIPDHEEPISISIVKMKGKYTHEDMAYGSIDEICYPGSLIIKDKYLKPPCKHGNFQQMNLLLVMSDEWHVIE